MKLKLSRESRNPANMWFVSANQPQDNLMGRSKQVHLAVR